ncbi:MAG: hypothetical protein RI897_2371 [Verrucomicrobiota bacterium]
MGLEGEGTFIDFAFEALAGLGAGGFVVLENREAVDFDGDTIALDDDFLGPPFAVFGGLLADGGEAVEAAGFDPVTVGVIDLAFEATAGPITFLVAGMEVDTAVGAGFRLDFDLEVEVFEGFLVADVEQVAAFACGDEHAVLDGPGIGVFHGLFPAGEGFAIHEGDEAFLGISGGAGESDEGESQQGLESGFHGREQ